MQGKSILGRRISLSEAKAERTWYLRTSQEVSVAEAGSGREQDCGECYVGSYRLVFFFFFPSNPLELWIFKLSLWLLC